MGQYCGTYDGEVRDDRVQVLDTDGDQVVTVQGNEIDGGLTPGADTGVVTVESREPGGEGTYLYDLDSGRFLRISDGVSRWEGTSGPTLDGQFFYDTPEGRHGRTQHLAELLG
jgi:hypothetical protein